MLRKIKTMSKLLKKLLKVCTRRYVYILPAMTSYCENSSLGCQDCCANTNAIYLLTCLLKQKTKTIMNLCYDMNDASIYKHTSHHESLKTQHYLRQNTASSGNTFTHSSTLKQLLRGQHVRRQVWSAHSGKWHEQLLLKNGTWEVHNTAYGNVADHTPTTVHCRYEANGGGVCESTCTKCWLGGTKLWHKGEWVSRLNVPLDTLKCHCRDDFYTSDDTTHSIKALKEASWPLR